MTSKSDQKVARIRNAIIGVAAAVILLVFAYGMLYTSGVTQGEFVAGEHYQVFDSPARRRSGAAITVVEFFSYSCIHCRDFDPMVEEWQAGLPDGVVFSRSPVTFSPAWAILAQTFLTLQEIGILSENHQRVFTHIHDRRVQFNSAEQMAEFIDGHGATKEEFLATFNSPGIRRAMRRADGSQRDSNIATIPTLVVAGKYSVSMDHGKKVALEIVDHLIALVQQEEQAVENPEISGD